jgi:hypothetical protein
VEAACVHMRPTYVSSEWISSNPMQRGGAPAYGGQSRFWRRRAYMCALPMSVLGGSRRIQCGEAVLRLTVAGVDGGGGVHTCARPIYVGSRWISSDSM